MRLIVYIPDHSDFQRAEGMACRWEWPRAEAMGCRWERLTAEAMGYQMLKVLKMQCSSIQKESQVSKREVCYTWHCKWIYDTHFISVACETRKAYCIFNIASSTTRHDKHSVCLKSIGVISFVNFSVIIELAETIGLSGIYSYTN